MATSYDLGGRAAVITGGAKGIGYAAAERMLECGARVEIWDIDDAAMAAAQEALSGKGEIAVRHVDIGSSQDVNAGAKAAIDRFGKVDILVANAAVTGVIQNLWEYTDEQWSRVLHYDLNGAFYCCRAFAPHMIGNGYGRIVVVSSIAGMEGAATNSAYSTAKAGLVGMVKAMGKEAAMTGLAVNAIAPSAIETPFLAGVTEEYLETVTSRMPMNRLGRPEECAALICWLSSEECSFSTGAVFDISGGRAVY